MRFGSQSLFVHYIIFKCTHELAPLVLGSQRKHEATQSGFYSELS